MLLFPFSPQGISDKLAQLYALTDPLLNMEAAAIKTDFKKWMKDNFQLNTQQQTYLNGMDGHAATSYGELCAICFSYRLPIKLVQPEPIPGYAKWTVATSTISIQANDAGQVTATGGVTFSIVYKV